MTTDNPTAPKGSGGPPTEPGWYWARRDDECPWWPVMVVRMDSQDGFGPRFVASEGGHSNERMRDFDWGPRIPTPDESEPATPTDGPTETSAFPVTTVEIINGLRHALAESRAEVERLRTDLQTLMSMRDALASDREALRDRVRVLESAIRKCRPTLDRASHCLQEDGGFKTYSPMIESIKDAQRAIDRALSTTQEPADPTDGPMEIRVKILRELAAELRIVASAVHPNHPLLASSAEFAVSLADEYERRATTQEPPAKEPTP